jgi:predicted RecB family nuclease
VSAGAPPVRDRPRRVTANHLRQIHRCDRELYLGIHEPAERAEPTEFERNLRQAGMDHERAMRSLFPGLIGPVYGHDGAVDEAVAETLRYLRESRAPLYQPVFVSADGRRIAVPDFIYWEDERLIVCDAKLRTRIGRGGDLALQMAHYRALAEEASGVAVARCEILNGDGVFVAIEPCEPASYERTVREVIALLGPGPEPDTLKSHSTCQACGYNGHCWTRATAEGRIEVLPAVRNDAVPRLRAAGMRTFHDVTRVAPESVEGIKPGVLDRIRLEARAWVDGRAVWLPGAGVPAGRPIVWFDLEGDPGNDSEVPVYLWGVALDHGDTIDYRPVFARSGPDGDREAWERFLGIAAEWSDRHPGALWVHYSDYEKMWLLRYVERHGDPGGVAARVSGALFDLHHALRAAAVLPLRSYSIKEVAPWLGFQWTHADMSSQWSTVQYRLAQATGDPQQRQQVLDTIAAYNRDDLLAMKAVWSWMAAGRAAAQAAELDSARRGRLPFPPLPGPPGTSGAV